jgi:hypothetical protein
MGKSAEFLTQNSVVKHYFLKEIMRKNHILKLEKSSIVLLIIRCHTYNR